MHRVAFEGIALLGGCGLFGVGVALLEEVCHWEWALGFQKLKPDPVCCFFPAAR